MQPRPGAALVVAQPELLLAILMEAFHGPALVRQAELVSQRTVIQVPREVPLRLTLLAGHWAFPEQPALRPGDVAVRPLHAQPARLPLAALLLWVQDRDRLPPLRRDRCRQRACRVQRRELSRVRVAARAPGAGVRAVRGVAVPGRAPGPARGWQRLGGGGRDLLR